MPIGDSRDGFLYPTLTIMMVSYSLLSLKPHLLLELLSTVLLVIEEVIFFSISLIKTVTGISFSSAGLFLAFFRCLRRSILRICRTSSDSSLPYDKKKINDCTVKPV